MELPSPFFRHSSISGRERWLSIESQSLSESKVTVPSEAIIVTLTSSGKYATSEEASESASTSIWA